MDSRRQRSQRSPDPLDRRLDRWLDTGRQLVDGVSGARPGRRSIDRLDGASRLDAVGRWVGDRIDWLLDEEDDWREMAERPQSSQAVRPARADSAITGDRSARSGRKRPLQALSRRRWPLLLRRRLPLTMTSGRKTTVSEWSAGSAPQVVRVLLIRLLRQPHARHRVVRYRDPVAVVIKRQHFYLG
jgi:hypothetical protein